MAQLTGALTQAPERIEFWGGEPLVYWKTLKPLAERLRVLYPQAQFSIITNGSLLNTEINDWLDSLGFSVGISHDGPGQSVRGPDPLGDVEQRAGIMDLYGRLKPQGRISINTMMHKGNKSRAAVQTWMRERFGDDVVIGEGAFIDPYDEGGMAATLGSTAEQMDYRETAFHEIRTAQVTSFDIVHTKLKAFVSSVRFARPATSIGQKCSMDRSDNLAVDLHGNVLTCQNVSAASIGPNGQSHLIGKLDDLPHVLMKTATHWSQRNECNNCPVLQICQGSCMFLHGPLWDAGCDASYSDNIPFFVAGLEYMTGCKPYYIEGDLRESRKDIFGLVHGIPKEPVRRVIHIHAA
ncbi:MAG: SPASM domain-containing protein [Burkholderiaceae bacterium]